MLWREAPRAIISLLAKKPTAEKAEIVHTKEA